jgi:hypothetical protein
MSEKILHRGCGGELIKIDEGTIYTIEVEVFKCQACGAEIDITDGEMEFLS